MHVAVASFKGGVGKTTTAIHIAAYLQTLGPTLLLDGDGFARFSSPRLATRNTHGTGCTLSSAIAAALGKGEPLRQAVASAKRYLDQALAGADRLRVGHGPGPLDHFARWREA